MPERAGLTSTQVSDSGLASDKHNMGHGPIINLLGLELENSFPNSVMRPFIYLS